MLDHENLNEDLDGRVPAEDTRNGQDMSSDCRNAKRQRRAIRRSRSEVLEDLLSARMLGYTCVSSDG